MNIWEAGLIVLVVGTIMLATIEQARIFYRRNLKTYRADIRAYLTSIGLELIEVRFPLESDWNKSPFKAPQKGEFSFFFLTINNSPISWTDEQHLIIVAENKRNTEKTVWLKITTTYFRKPVLEFRRK